MTELLDTAPKIDVDPAEYARLLGYPRNHAFTGRAAELVEGAKSWFAKNAHPWLYARECRAMKIENETITLDTEKVQSPRLSQMLTTAGATSAFLVAVSAGPEAEAEAQRLWRDEKPDEYFFLEIYASAVVEHLTTMAGARLCAWADPQRLAILPHYSPGYPEWDIAQQPSLLQLLKRNAQHRPLQELETLSSGMLRPKKSLLALFGVTAQIDKVQPLASLVPCQNCSYPRCEFRRAPFKRAQAPESEVAAAAPNDQPAATALPLLSQSPRYLINRRALERWSRDRLTLTPQSDGTTAALFRFEGTTCSNMGHPLLFHYQVTLGPREEGYPVRDMACTPAPGDDGYQFMCGYLAAPDQLMQEITQEKSLVGKSLEETLHHDRPGTAPSCYCEHDSRAHKWGLVFETIHFALARQEQAAGVLAAKETL